MSKQMPPIPPASRSKKGPDLEVSAKDAEVRGRKPVPQNLKEQGHQGNIAQNTHHQGYQQDR